MAAVTALYRKYRPQDFDEVVGQEAVVRTLRNAIARRPGAPGLPLRRPARDRQDLAGAHPREGAELRARADADAGQDLQRVRDDRERHLARRGRDGRRLAARDRRHPRDPRARRPPAGRGPLQGLHPRRGAPAHRRRLERAPEADRGAAAAPRLRLLHDRPARRCSRPSARAARPSSSRGRGCRSWRSSCAGSPTARGSRRPTRRSRSSRAAPAAASATRSRRSTSSRRRPTARSPSRPCSSCSARSRRRRSSASATSSSTATPPALLAFVEELAEQGQDLGRLVTDLLEHLRHLLLVQHMGEVPDSLPVTEETRERLRDAGEPARRGRRCCA